METPSEKDMSAMIDYWRSLVPRRPLTYGQHIDYAQVQAYHVRAFADSGALDLNLIWLFEQTVIPVKWTPSHVLNGRSGLTTDLPDNTLKILLNQNHPDLRQRYTLVHEWKHALDYYDNDLLYRDLGGSDDEKRRTQREAIANEFAAEVLMPMTLVTKRWWQTPDLQVLARDFNVSTEAMKARLEKLGLIGGPRPRPRGYFRERLILDQSACAACAA
jgi:hypothetical protein